MTELILELAPELYERLEVQAKQVGKSAQIIAQEWLADRLVWPSPTSSSEREQAIEALRTAGLLTELGPEMKKRAERSSMTLEEVRDALDRADGQPLSELILEMRGPKE